MCENLLTYSYIEQVECNVVTHENIDHKNIHMTSNFIYSLLYGVFVVLSCFCLFQDVCLALQCSKLHYLTNGECHRLFSTFDGIIYYRLHLRLSPKSSLKLKDVFSEKPALERNMNTRVLDRAYKQNSYLRNVYSLFYFTLYDKLDNETNLHDSGINVSESAVKYIHVVYRFELAVPHDPYELADNFKFHQNDIFVHGMIGDDIVLTAHVLGVSSLYFTESDVRENGEVNVGEFASWEATINNIAAYYKVDELQQVILPYYLDVLKEYNSRFENDISLDSIRNCSTVDISNKDWVWDITDQGLYFKDYKYAVKYEDFYFKTPFDVRMCRNAFIQMLNSVDVLLLSKTPQGVGIESLVSIVCVSVSVICLSVTIFVFGNLPSLRTLPGLNILTLSFSLLVAQSMYLVSSFGHLEQGSWTCIGVGLLLHFFSLLAIFWMCICTLHMFRVLTTTKVRSNSYRKQYAIFHTFATLLSLLFVAACIAISLLRSNGSDVGYGSITCYFSSAILLRYTFVVPVFVVVIANCSMFTIIVLKFQRGPTYLRKNVQNRNEFMIFIKLSTLTGITWLFGVLYSWLNIEVLSYIFITLNASQGVFIMMSFVVNRRVYRLGKERLTQSWATGNHFSQTGRTTTEWRMTSTKSKNTSSKWKLAGDTIGRSVVKIEAYLDSVNIEVVRTATGPPLPARNIGCEMVHVDKSVVRMVAGHRNVNVDGSVTDTAIPTDVGSHEQSTGNTAPERF